MANREEVQSALARLLIEKVRRDPYPSATQMALLEQVIPQQLVGDYLNVLFEKVSKDNTPSIYMLHRIRRIAEQLPPARASSRNT